MSARVVLLELGRCNIIALVHSSCVVAVNVAQIDNAAMVWAEIGNERCEALRRNAGPANSQCSCLVRAIAACSADHGICTRLKHYASKSVRQRLVDSLEIQAPSEHVGVDGAAGSREVVALLVDPEVVPQRAVVCHRDDELQKLRRQRSEVQLRNKAASKTSAGKGETLRQVTPASKRRENEGLASVVRARW